MDVFCHQHIPAQQQEAQHRNKTQTGHCKDTKPTGALGVEVAPTGFFFFISSSGNGPHPMGRGVTGHAGSPYIILSGAKEQESKDRAPCPPVWQSGSQPPAASTMGPSSSSVSLHVISGGHQAGPGTGLRREAAAHHNPHGVPSILPLAIWAWRRNMGHIT